MKRIANCLWMLLAASWLVSPSLSWGQEPPIVEVTTIENRVVRVPQTFVGTVLPLRKAVVGSAVDGRVVEFPIREGDRVEQGQTLAVLLTETIRLERDAAQGELELRMAELEELENGSLPEEVSQAAARLEASEAAMTYYQLRLERAERLDRGGVATDEELQEATSAARRTREEYKEALAAYQLIKQGPRKERIAQARARVVVQQAVVDRLDEQIRRHTIISRFPGYISMEFTEEGSWVNSGDQIAEVVDLDEVEIEVHVPETRISQIRLRESRLTVEIPAVPDFDFSGSSAPRVEAIVPQADVRSRTFRVKVRVKNQIQEGTQQPSIKAGMLARVTLPVGEREGLVVPKDSLVLGGSDPIILVIDPASIESYQDMRTGRNMARGAVQRIPVTLGVEDGSGISVTGLAGTLTEGLLVITKGNERVRPGTPDQPSLVRWAVPDSVVSR